MTVTEIIAEILGFAALSIGFLIFQQKKRTGILAFKLSSDILWIIHFLLLGATSGMILSSVGVCRSIVFLVLALCGREIKPVWLLVFTFAGVGAIILTWKDVYSICSVISCVLATLGYWQKKPTNMKIISIFICASQITYACFIGSISVIINELLTLGSIAIFFVRLYAERRRKAKSTATR